MKTPKAVASAVRSPVTQVGVPTINDGLHDFGKLYSLYGKALMSTGPLVFEFSRCEFLRHNAVAFLAGLIRFMAATGREVRVNWSSCSTKVLRNLELNGFAAHFQSRDLPVGTGILGGQKAASGNTVPLRHYRASAEEDAIVHYLSADWLGRGWVNLSEELAGAIIGNVWEVYANGFEHANSPIGLFSCGQYYPAHKRLALAVVDFGVGIVGNVRRYLERPQMPAPEALKWALKTGNSTRVGTPGGLGLDMLREFVRINKGEIAIYSREGYYRWYNGSDQFGSMPSDFRGTLVNIALVCDELFYYFASE